VLKLVHKYQLMFMLRRENYDVRVPRERNVRRHKLFHSFGFHRAMHRNIISIVKPTRCINVSNLFYFARALYMFRTVFPSIIRSSRLYIQKQAFVKQVLLSASNLIHLCI